MKKRILISALCIAMTASDLAGGIPVVRAQEAVSEIVTEAEEMIAENEDAVNIEAVAEAEDVEAVEAVAEAEDVEAVEAVAEAEDVEAVETVADAESIETVEENETADETVVEVSENLEIEVPVESMEIMEEIGEENLADTYTMTAPVVGKWTGRWVANWDTNVDAGNDFQYQVQIYKDGKEHSSGFYISSAFSVCLARNITEDGVYKYRVRKVDMSWNPLSAWSKFSNDRTYVRPDKQIETVKGYWDPDIVGCMKFVNPPYFGSHFDAKIEYRKDETSKYEQVTAFNTSYLHTEDFEEPVGKVTSANFGREFLKQFGYGAGQYRFAVRLYSQNIDECAQNPNFGEWSDPITYTEEDFKEPEVVYTEKAPEKGSWADKWVATWTNKGNAYNLYGVEIWKDGEKLNGTVEHIYQEKAQISLASFIKESGTYKFRIRIMNNNYQDISDWSEFSEEKIYTRPSTQMAKVTAYWDEEKLFSAYFNAPNYYYGSYMAEFQYRANENDGFHNIATYIMDGNSAPGEMFTKGTKQDISSFKDRIVERGAGQYRYRVRVISKDIDKCAQNDAYGDWSELLVVTADDIKAYEEANKLSVVDSLSWENSWVACWHESEAGKQYFRYDIEIWKDGKYFASESTHGGYQSTMEYSLMRSITESGKYQFRVKKSTYDYPVKESDWSELSEAKTYVKPAKQMPTVKATWSTKNKYGNSFVAPDCFDGAYAIMMQYRKDENDTFKDTYLTSYRGGLIVPKGTEVSDMIIENYIDRYGTGQYRFAIRLYSGDLSKYAHGQYSDYSEARTFTEKDLLPAVPKCTVKGVFGGRTVTFENEGLFSQMYYALKKSTVELTDNNVLYSGQNILFTDFYGYVYYAAYRNGKWSDTKSILLKIPTIQKPVITQSGNKVTIKTATPNCHIWYTTDGSDPVVNTDGTSPNAKRISYNSTATIEVSKATTIKAIAVRSAFTNSEITSFKATAVKVAAPSFKVVGAIGGRNVTFSSTDKDAVIYYSTTTSNITTKDKCVKNGETKLFTSYYGSLYAKAYVNGTFSNVSRLILKIPTVNTPSITAEGNGYVKISTTTPSCAIYYTIDGTTPSPTNGKKINASSSKVYVGAGKTVKAIAVRSCFSNSAVATQKAK